MLRHTPQNRGCVQFLLGESYIRILSRMVSKSNAYRIDKPSRSKGKHGKRYPVKNGAVFTFREEQYLSWLQFTEQYETPKHEGSVNICTHVCSHVCIDTDVDFSHTVASPQSAFHRRPSLQNAAANFLTDPILNKLFSSFALPSISPVSLITESSVVKA